MEISVNKAVLQVLAVLSLGLITVLPGCTSPVGISTATAMTVPGAELWGIYRMDIESGQTGLIYGSSREIQTSALRLKDDKFVFAMKAEGENDDDLEIFIVDTDGQNLTRLTENRVMDVYPVWSPAGDQIAFLSKRGEDLDIYLVNSNGQEQDILFDSGFNDADIDWAGDTIVFTSQFQIWKMKSDGSQAEPLTDPPQRGRWGSANLPSGDFDPRLSPDGGTVVFERLEDTERPNGGYNLFTTGIDGSGEKRLTDNYYAQGLASWSHDGSRLVYSVAAIEGKGLYHIYIINADGSGNRDITPDYFPPGFLSCSPIFSADDTAVFFIGQRWQ